MKWYHYVLIAVGVLAILGGTFFLGRASAPNVAQQHDAPVQAPAAPAPQQSKLSGPSASTDGYGLQPQPYIPHPSLYLETGHTGTDEQKTKTWTLNVLDGATLVYGGYRVDGVNGGVYGAIQGPTTVTITVTDGFVSIVTNDWAQQEYCFRLGQALQYGWAHAYLHPLTGWTCQ